MFPARCVKDRLDTPVNAQKRWALQNESSSTHHDRLSKTCITLKIARAIPKMTFLYSSENALYENILHREHHFYNRVSRKPTLVFEIYKNASNYKTRITISVGNTHSAWKCCLYLFTGDTQSYQMQDAWICINACTQKKHTAKQNN